MQKEIVIDTSIILDILLTSRPGHRFGKLIGVYLIDNGVRITVPLHAMFEIKSALLHAKHDAAAKGGEIRINEDVSESTPLQYNFIPIDNAFFEKYFDAELPHIKAGDYMNVALAKADGLTLLTDDPVQYDAAKEAGVKVHNSEEFRKICLTSLQ
jgi:predicted nucleic acid-binding protein